MMEPGLLALWRAAYSDRVHAAALIDSARGIAVSHGELDALVVARAAQLHAHGGLLLLVGAGSVDAIAWYLAALDARVPVILADATPHAVGNLVGAYAPTMVAAGPGMNATLGEAGYRAATARGDEALTLWVGADGTADAAIAPALAVMLQTSGSTGNPKLVRLSPQNLASNALAIAAYLGLDANERSVQALPMQYSYGLSLLHSHLVVAATSVLPAHSFLRAEFWGEMQAHAVTSFAGVPFMYEALLRVRWSPTKTASLRTLTQAGGRLAPEFVAKLHAGMEASGGRVFVMYGQTEATARMAYVPPDRLLGKPGSIGVAIPGGTLTIVDSELEYRGPGVMLGYASGRADLALGDVCEGVLATGDLGHVDDDGFFYVTARKSRFAKLFGKRVSLDDVEVIAEAQARAAVAAVEHNGKLRLAVEDDAGEVALGDLCQAVCQHLGVAASAVDAIAMPVLPRNARGKKDYAALLSALA
ncbi:MAG: AMP-binding protein [Myxococcales bacterium]|nr:AMP-binding protein [Myxococcales bacterium]